VASWWGGGGDEFSQRAPNTLAPALSIYHFGVFLSSPLEVRYIPHAYCDLK
jgi:hypothetical protein